MFELIPLDYLNMEILSVRTNSPGLSEYGNIKCLKLFPLDYLNMEILNVWTNSPGLSEYGNI